MAKTYTVKAGDTLSGIALAQLGSASKYKWLATINGIDNPNLIYVGQVLKLEQDSGSTSSSTKASSNMVTNIHFGRMSYPKDSNTLFASWKWNKSNTASYKVQWTYDTGNGVWFGSSSTITVDEDDPSISRQSTYSIPSGARRVRFKVKPISKTKKDDKGNEKSYWTAKWSTITSKTTWTKTDSTTPLDTPSVPTVTVDKYKLTAELTNISISGANSIVFQIVKNDSGKPFKTSDPVSIVSTDASYSCSIAAGGKYKVRCYAYNKKNKNKSEWSDYTADYETIPAASSGITKIQASTSTEVYLEWGKATGATKYDIEYTTDKKYFDTSDQTTTKTGIESTKYYMSGLESGHEYFFRVRAVNDKGESAWSGIKSVTIGTKPVAPTTWSSTTTVVSGESAILYWMHNSEDGSGQTKATVELTTGSTVKNANLTGDKGKLEAGEVGSYTIDTKDIAVGTELKWRVKTAGCTGEYGDWSIQRSIKIYAAPTLELSVEDVDGNSIAGKTLKSFPFYINAVPGPTKPIGYHITVVANDSYETVDNVGNPKIVSAGDEIYSKYVDIQTELMVEMSANNIDLENNVSYTIKCIASMDTGLTVDNSAEFSVKWSETTYELNAEIGINNSNYTATVRPYCEESTYDYYKVNYVGGKYVADPNKPYSFISGERVKKAKTTAGRPVYSGITPDGNEVYFCIIETKYDVTNVTLSVYRREYDGSFTELATNLDGAKRTTITDPHPALDYARYRIVAKDKDTGAVSYYDPPGYAVGCNAVIIQWDEEWSEFDTTEDATLEQPAWTGSLLQLPYNVDISDNHSPDIELVEYIGRAHPVSYYGTQLGVTSTWNMVIEKDDEETLYALRRLARWMGDVYVREPSGSGYWASITVSFSQKHCDVTIPVSISVTRVEGGA